MASFQKRGKTWQYTVSAKPKPIRKGGFRTKKEAQVAAAEVEAKLQKGVVPHLRKEPFDEYFEGWIRTYKTDIAKNTLERYYTTLETVREHFAGVPIQSITKRSYQSFLNEYAKTHAKATTRKLNTHIRACVKDAIDEGIIAIDFTRNATLTGNLAAKKPEEKHLSYFESKRLLAELYKRLDSGLTYYLLLLGLTSGMRFGEMVGLTKKDFDYRANTITVNKAWGYTRRMPSGFCKTKNEQSNRVIRMDRHTMDVFKNLIESGPANIHGLVFFSPRSKYQVISNTAANKVLKGLLEKMNIEPISLHGLRHTHASILLYKRLSIYYVSERLGHKDIQTTLDTYAHVVKELRTEDEMSAAATFEAMTAGFTH
ncbi:tyrosine-type recombinase/integrase [Numidum massiliense]|uniref:tyrosine-type recombinase/integrase n=1 Tax=Numidum massiliense TaxID=1522315 RepID=UPI0006D52CCB|nr:site-specific integrase [Numidum massiliense]